MLSRQGEGLRRPWLLGLTVRHQRGIAATPGRRGVFRPLAIPTAILVDGSGMVRWIDQTDDYRLRADAERVAAAVRDALGRGS